MDRMRWSGHTRIGLYTVAALIWRAGERCTWCGRQVGPGDYHIDHLVPRSKGGSDAPDNLVLACPECNTEKYNKTRPSNKRRTENQIQQAIKHQIAIQVGRGSAANRSARALAERYFAAALEKDRAYSRAWKTRKDEAPKEPWEEA